jgi:Flp pilus assembly CpaE family ATPase
LELKERVKKMASYLDNEAIASALKIPVETVNDILSGKAEIKEAPAVPVVSTIQVNSIKTAYRQRVIAVWRAKGGVGCTAVAMYLAFVLKDLMRVLLIDFNLAEGGSDLSYYMDLPEYPTMELAGDDFNSAVIQVEKMLYVLQAPRQRHETFLSKEFVAGIMTAAKQDYDAVIVDLPNMEDEATREAVRYANTLVMVTSGSYQELVRLALRASEFNQKDILLLANRCQIDKKVMETMGLNQIVHISEDRDLADKMDKHALPRRGSPFMKGIEKLKETLYEESNSKRSLIKSLFAIN